MKQKPSLLINYDYQLYPHTERREFAPPYLLQQALSAFFDVYERDQIDYKQADVVFNTLPIVSHGGAGQDLFLTGKITFWWDLTPLEKIWTENFDSSDYVFYTVPSYASKYPKEKSEVMLPAIDDKHYFRISCDMVYDVGFLGSEVVAWRINLLNELQKDFSVLRGQTGLGIPSSTLLSQCKMVLSIDDYHEKKAGVEQRTFTFGNIRPILVPYNPDYELVGRPFYHYLPYQNVEELKKRISYYLMHAYDRESIGRNMLRRLALAHTYAKRAKQVFNAYKRIKKSKAD